MTSQPWLCLALAFLATSWSFSAISRADRGARIHGHFPDVDVLRVDWRTAPLGAAQIPVPWLARKVHNWSVRKIVANPGAVESGIVLLNEKRIVLPMQKQRRRRSVGSHRGIGDVFFDLIQI